MALGREDRCRHITTDRTLNEPHLSVTANIEGEEKAARREEAG
jgi:hypothetical protein